MLRNKWNDFHHQLRFYWFCYLRPGAISNRLMSRCRVCGSRKEVICYDPRTILHYFRRKTYCPDHCPDHYYVYERSERHHFCETCGIPAPPDWYAERFD